MMDWSGLVWSCLVLGLFGLVWSCLVLSWLVWSGLVWSWLVWSGLVLSFLVWACLVLSCLVLSCRVLSCLVLFLSCLVSSGLVLRTPLISPSWANQPCRALLARISKMRTIPSAAPATNREPLWLNDTALTTVGGSKGMVCSTLFVSEYDAR